MAKFNLYLPKWVKDEMDKLGDSAGKRNWSAYLAKLIINEVDTLTSPARIPADLSDEAVAEIVRRLRQNATIEVSEAIFEGRYEGFLWAKYYATREQLESIVSTLPPSPRSRRGHTPVTTRRPPLRLTLDPRTDLWLENPPSVEWRFNSNTYARNMFEAHKNEVGVSNGIVHHPQKVLGLWSLHYSANGVLLEDGRPRTTPSKTIDQIYTERGGLYLPPASPAFNAWTAAFLEGAAPVFFRVKELIDKRGGG